MSILKPRRSIRLGMVKILYLLVLYSSLIRKSSHIALIFDVNNRGTVVCVDSKSLL